MKQPSKKTTYELLLEKHGVRYVNFIEAKPYFGISEEKTFRDLVLKNRLGGLRAFKSYDSRKAPLLIDLENLAEVLDKRAQEAKNGTPISTL